MNFKTFAAVVVFSAAADAAKAQTTTTTKKPVSTIKNDKARIKQEVKSGELTKPETARLAAQTAKLKNEKEAYKADGVVTAQERKEYRSDKKKVSRRIYRQKNDAQTRP